METTGKVTASCGYPLYWQDNARTLYLGDCRDVLAAMPENSVHCIVSSPPYWGQRKYTGEQEQMWPDGWRGGHGLEPTLDMWIAHEVQVLRAVRRVLRPDGVCWWNVGDSAASGNRTSDKPDSISKNTRDLPLESRANRTTVGTGLADLNTCLIPFRLAIALQEDGWYLRQEIIWHKPNPMPQSVAGWRWQRHRVKVGSKRQATQGYAAELKMRDHSGDFRLKRNQDTEWIDCPGCSRCSPNDGLVLRKGNWRPTKAHEYILMLTKTNSYYCDQEAVREAHMPESLVRYEYGLHCQAPDDGYIQAGAKDGAFQCDRMGDHINPNGRNLRSIWTFATEPFPRELKRYGRHFAAFPRKLPELCIKAGTPEYGVCARCGAPWARVIEHKNMKIDRSNHANESGIRVMSSGTMLEDAETKTLGWRATCKCGTEVVPATVLDCFMGTGTTLEVAASLGRRAIGIDISEPYLKLSIQRNKQGVLKYGHLMQAVMEGRE